MRKGRGSRGGGVGPGAQAPLAEGVGSRQSLPCAGRAARTSGEGPALPEAAAAPPPHFPRRDGTGPEVAQLQAVSPERALPGRARRADWRAGGSSTSRRPCGRGADPRPGPQAGGQLTQAPLGCGQDVGARRRPGGVGGESPGEPTQSSGMGGVSRWGGLGRHFLPPQPRVLFNPY